MIIIQNSYHAHHPIKLVDVILYKRLIKSILIAGIIKTEGRFLTQINLDEFIISVYDEALCIEWTTIPHYRCCFIERRVNNNYHYPLMAGIVVRGRGDGDVG